MFMETQLVLEQLHADWCMLRAYSVCSIVAIPADTIILVNVGYEGAAIMMRFGSQEGSKRSLGTCGQHRVQTN